MEDVSKSDIYETADQASLQAHIGSDGVCLAIQRYGHEVAITLTAEQFDDFTNDVMRLIYAS